MNEKRKSQRIAANLPVIFKSPADLSTSFASTENISARGLCLLAKERIPIGKKWPLKLELPSGEQFSLQSEIIWSMDWPVLVENQYKMGIKVLNAVNSSLARFEKYYVQEFQEAKFAA